MMSPNGPSLMQFNQELNQAMQRTAPRSGFTNFSSVGFSMQKQSARCYAPLLRDRFGVTPKPIAAATATQTNPRARKFPRRNPRRG